MIHMELPDAIVCAHGHELVNICVCHGRNIVDGLSQQPEPGSSLPQAQTGQDAFSVSAASGP